MRLDQKYFNVFMLGIAVICAIAILWGTISYKGDQLTSFKKEVVTYDSLTISHLRLLTTTDSLTIEDLKGKPVVLQFWSSWSEKSTFMREEFLALDGFDSLYVVAASVRDVLDDARKIAEEVGTEQMIFVDGTQLYNALQTPGIPSYVLFNKDGEPVNAHVGYEQGSIQDSLMHYLGNE